jgi:hypothetical protein
VRAVNVGHVNVVGKVNDECVNGTRQRGVIFFFVYVIKKVYGW